MFSHSLHLSCTFSIRPYSPMGLPSELPLCLQKKKMTFPLPIPKSKLHHSNCVPNKCTAQLLLNVFFSHSLCLHLSNPRESLHWREICLNNFLRRGTKLKICSKTKL